MGKHQVFKLSPLPSGQGQRKVRASLKSTRRQFRKQSKRGKSGRTPRRDIGPAAPPALSMMSNQCSLWLRTVQKLSFTNAKYNEKWNPSITTLIGNPWKPLANLFAELKVLRVNVYLYTRNTSLSSVGIHSLVVADKDEVYDVARDFISTSSTPGAVTRRITQPLHGTWFPTEPSDRDWTLFNDATTYLDVVYAVDGATLPLEFDLFFDVHCRFRGLKHLTSVSDQRSECSQLVASINDVQLTSGPSSVDSDVSFLA